VNRSVQAEEFQRRNRSLQRQEWQIWFGALLFMLAVMIGLALVTPRANASRLPFILLGFIALAVPVSLTLRKSKQALNNARQRLIRETLLSDAATSLDLVDPLTGLLNRRYLDSYASKEFGVADRTGLSLTFLVIGLRSFRSPKVGLGQPAADRFVMAIADLLRTNFRTSDTIIRSGEREFLVLMLGCKEARARDVADRFLAEVERWNREKAGEGYEMTLTSGTAAYAKGADVAALLGDLRLQLTPHFETGLAVAEK
jgi:diguanylate cyclase (GGDEF)-like protein